MRALDAVVHDVVTVGPGRRRDDPGLVREACPLDGISLSGPASC
jgi:hypothetical protein